jgi:hypothetical protein|uniref:KTSC domain n=1 Tax=Myoviridae sp. ctshb19 TaxID=2825194 RepID=A0A8S5UG03_9CAUD|nr:MAG TPA: KTSC domain [Myoviridae sp. ctshb19]
MTNVTHTVQALLVVAAEQLIARNKQHKKETGEPLFKLGDDIGNGITYRELNSWLKDFKAKQASAGTPAPKATETKTAPAPKTSAPKADAVEIKSGAIREAGVVMIGRNKENVLRISNIGGVRTVVTDKGHKIAAADLEFNNRGALRVKLDKVDGYIAAAKAATAAPASKASTKAPAVEHEDFPAEVPASTKTGAKASAKAPAETEGRVFPIRDLKIKTSTQLTGAQYDRNTKTLYVTLKDKAVWAYEDMALKDVRAFEESAQPWKHFSAHIANVKKGRMVKNHAAQAKAAPAPKADAKPAAKAPAEKAPAAASISTTRLRAEGFVDGRSKEQVEKIMRVKETDERVVITTSGKRIPLAAIIEAKGKFRVSDLALISGAMAPAVKPAENTRKAPAKQAAQEVNGKAPKLNFAEAEAKGVVKKGTVVKPTRNEIKELGVRVVKGAKSKVVSVLRIVKRDGVSTVVSAAAGHAGLPVDLIYMNDGQPTYASTLTAAEYNAL